MQKKYYYGKNTQEQLLETEARLVYAADSIDEHDWKSIMHTHDLCEIFYVTGGAGYFQTEEDRIRVGTGDVVIVNPHIPHLEHSEEGQSLKYIVLAVSGVSFRPEDSPEKGLLYLSADTFGETLAFCLRKIIEETSAKSEHYLLAVDNLFTLLLIQLSREAKLYRQEKQQQEFSPEILIAKQYIDNYYANEIDVDLLTQKTFLSKFHFIRQFKEEIGESPMAYLANRRLQEACSLLQYSDHSISQICNLVGYSNPLYFSQAFKKSKGISPIQYRKLHREQEEGEKI